MLIFRQICWRRCRYISLIIPFVTGKPHGILTRRGRVPNTHNSGFLPPEITGRRVRWLKYYYFPDMIFWLSTQVHLCLYFSLYRGHTICDLSSASNSVDLYMSCSQANFSSPCHPLVVLDNPTCSYVHHCGLLITALTLRLLYSFIVEVCCPY